jgi:hypothetical protein
MGLKAIGLLLTGALRDSPKGKCSRGRKERRCRHKSNNYMAFNTFKKPLVSIFLSRREST